MKQQQISGFAANRIEFGDDRFRVDFHTCTIGSRCRTGRLRFVRQQNSFNKYVDPAIIFRPGGFMLWLIPSLIVLGAALMVILKLRAKGRA